MAGRIVVRSGAVVRSGLIVLLLATTAGPTMAQDGEAVDRGREVARTLCADCHAVEPDQVDSPLPEAPAFDEFADWKETTENALSVWLVTSHPTMPNLILGRDDAADVTAYILSLKN